MFVIMNIGQQKKLHITIYNFYIFKCCKLHSNMNNIGVLKPSETQPFDYIIKTVIIGDAGVGKTSILRQFTESKFNSEREATIGIDLGSRRMQINHDQQYSSSEKYLVTPHVSTNPTTQETRADGLHKIIKNPTYNFQIWDCAGQERFKSIVSSYLRGARVVLLTFDISNYRSFDNLDDWVYDIERQLNTPDEGNYILMLIGNKSDLRETRQVEFDEAEEYAKKLFDRVPYFEISAKDGNSVSRVFEYAMKEVYSRHLDGKMFFEHRTLRYESKPMQTLPSNNSCLPPGDCKLL